MVWGMVLSPERDGPITAEKITLEAGQIDTL
jgi:hypothetical protein